MTGSHVEQAVLQRRRQSRLSEGKGGPLGRWQARPLHQNCDAVAAAARPCWPQRCAVPTQLPIQQLMAAG